LADGPWEDNLYIQGLLRTQKSAVCRAEESLHHDLTMLLLLLLLLSRFSRVRLCATP